LEEYRNINEWVPGSDYPGSAFVLGRFDGVHLGHRSLIDRAIRAETTMGLRSVCFSFQECTYPGASERGILTFADEKSALLREIGIDILLQPEFKPPLIDMTAHSFLEGLLVNRWQAKKIIVGYDFHFGRDREGDADFLEREGAKLGVDIEVMSPFMIGDEIVKATRIRELIHDGDVAHAAKLLGRPYFVNVTAQAGRGLGKEIGFPTINFAWPELKVKPKVGIYAVRIESGEFVDGKILSRKLNGAANLGFQPTIDPDNMENRELVLEVHVLDNFPPRLLQHGSLPKDACYKIEFIDFIRAEEKFSSIDELRTQISKDCSKARETLQGLPT